MAEAVRSAAPGASAELLHLPDHDVRGNGHGLIYEKNSDAALVPVLAWIVRHTEHEAAMPTTSVERSSAGQAQAD